MAKLITLLCIIAILLLCNGRAAIAGRPPPALYHIQDFEVEQTEMMVEDSCKGVGEEECLIRRTLAAHLDYVYTQKHKP